MEEEDSNCIQCQNPMEIDLIIETIVSYIYCLNDLTSCRLISRKWDPLVSPKLQKKMVSKSLVFEAQRQIRDFDAVEGKWVEYHPFTGDPTGSKLQDFLGFLQNSPGFITFTNFTFVDICVRHPITQQFLNSYGQLVATLTLDYKKLTPIQHAIGSGTRIQQRTEAFMNLIQEQCPNLEKLQIHGEYGPPPFLLDQQWQPKDIATKFKIKELTFNYDLFDHYEAQHENFLNGLISCCSSSLQKITFGSKTCNHNLPNRFLPQFINFCTSTLKELNIGGDIPTHAKIGSSETLLRLLRHPQLQLKRFRIHGEVYSAFSNENPLSKIMESQKSSLEEVSTHLFPSKGITPVRFPDCMPELKVFMASLDLWSPPLASTSFEDQLPSLRQFVLAAKSHIHPSWEGFKFFKDNSDPQLKLTELRLPFANSEVFEHAQRVFPNVKELVIETDLDGLCGIFSWSELESLHLTVRAREGQKHYGPTLEQVLDGHYGKLLRHLTKLKKLTINWKHPSNDNGGYESDRGFDSFDTSAEPFEMGILTDSSLVNVFSKLPKLEYISILEHEISHEAASKFLETVRMRRIEDDGFKCQKYYFQEDYIPHKLLVNFL